MQVAVTRQTITNKLLAVIEILPLAHHLAEMLPTSSLPSLIRCKYKYFPLAGEVDIALADFAEGNHHQAIGTSSGERWATSSFSRRVIGWNGSSCNGICGSAQESVNKGRYMRFWGPRHGRQTPGDNG